MIITERGKPIGQIVPIQEDLSGQLNKLVDAGLVEWNGEPVPAYQPVGINRSKYLLSDLVAEDRE